MRLYEPAIHMRPSSRSCDLQESSRRTDALAGCLQSVKDFFAAYASIPLELLGAMPLVATAYMSFAVVTASRILLLNDSDWTVSLARLTLDLAAACQTLSSRFEQADQVAQIAGRRRRFDNGVDVSVLLCYSVKIKWIRQWYLAKVAAESRPSASSNTQPMEFDRISATDESGSLPVQLDDDFWNALLTSTGPNAWAES